jgi:hypothetical protein
MKRAWLGAQKCMNKWLSRLLWLQIEGMNYLIYMLGYNILITNYSPNEMSEQI